MDRKIAVPRVMGDPDDFLIISALSGAAKDVGQITQESPNAFLMGGAMGAATMTGLGLALAQPERRVLVVTGDGELLMSVGSLAVVAAKKPPNLSILCVDNGVYGETGGQATHTSLGTDLEGMAQAAGISVTRTVGVESDLEDASKTLRASNGPVFVLLKVGPEPPPQYKRSFDAAARKTAFRDSLLASE